MQKEKKNLRASRILYELKEKYPTSNSFDLDDNYLHFVCEVEPTIDHPEYDKAIEVIISSKPHKHLISTQYYTVISGTLKLYINDECITLETGDKYTIHPNTIHWATSQDECWVEMISKPGWTKEDHILV